MDERYEIRGKTGQVGICPVYRAYDMRMGREVAIKRILSRFDHSKERENANKRIIAETSAIAALQHPHIVRIFDLGMDGSEPYVVTEFITGRRLDEIIATAPLTWPDFREFAMQSQEALIAAQDFNMIHSELKPSNIMVTWLASGKFQVKVMDFGLAALYRSQTTNGIEVNEFDFDSMFFMAPEQFEGQPLDARSDLYSMGCVYYYALTGTYPYTGISSSELMTAHLQHTVIPIQDLRKGVPIWVCDWVMWLINRNPQDRPESAREAFKIFIQKDSISESEMSLGSLKSKRSSLSIPGASTSLISIPPQIIEPKSLDHWRPGFDEVEEVSQPKDTSKKASAKLSVPHDGYNPNASSVGNHDRSILKPLNTNHAYPHVAPAHELKIPTGKMSIAAIVGLVTAVVFILVMVGWMLKSHSEKNQLEALCNELIALAGTQGVNEVKVDKGDLDLLLQMVSTTRDAQRREAIYTTFKFAKSTDGTDVNAYIESFVSHNHLPLDVQNKLIREVLKMRSEATVIADSTKVVAPIVNTPKVDPSIVDTPKVETFLATSEPDKSVTLQRFTGWTPAQLVCAAWYDASDASTITASGNAVSQWNDKKGTRHFTQTKSANKAAYVSNSYLQFDGTDDFMTTTGIGSSNVTVFGVVQVTTDNTNTDSGKAWLTELIGKENPDWSMKGLTSVDSLASLNIGPEQHYQSVSLPAFRDTTHIHAMTSFTSSSNGLVRVDGGIAQGELLGDGHNIQTGKGRTLYLGCQKYKVATRYHKGRVYEILILNKRLRPTDADYLRIEGYLAHKWGLVAQLPANHPYKNGSP